MKTVVAILLGLSALANAENLPEHFRCETNDEQGKIQISGFFTLKGDDMLGTGHVVLKFPERDATYTSGKGEFAKGMWMTDRMNLYLRDEQKHVIVGVIIDEFFDKMNQEVKGSLYGIFGNRALICRRIQTWSDSRTLGCSPWSDPECIPKPNPKPPKCPNPWSNPECLGEW